MNIINKYKITNYQMMKLIIINHKYWMQSNRYQKTICIIQLLKWIGFRKFKISKEYEQQVFQEMKKT